MANENSLCYDGITRHFHEFMDIITTGISFIVHFDRYLSFFVTEYGLATYLILFFIVFCETGLVVTPFLPGDSLVFVAGTLAAQGGLEVGLLFVVLVTSAIIGDAVNYWIGYTLRKGISGSPNARILKPEYIQKTQTYYEKYGEKTIVIARFIPMVRTFAPFFAGVGKMPYARFAAYNITGAVLWIVLFLSAGYFFGNIAWVQKHFTYVIFGIIFLSLLPNIIHVFRKIKSRK